MPTTNETVDQWFNTSFANGPLSRDTEAYNQVFAAKEKLKEALAAAAPVVPAPQKS